MLNLLHSSKNNAEWIWCSLRTRNPGRDQSGVLAAFWLSVFFLLNLKPVEVTNSGFWRKNPTAVAGGAVWIAGRAANGQTLRRLVVAKACLCALNNRWCHLINLRRGTLTSF
jgi:hypothetical protein